MCVYLRLVFELLIDGSLFAYLGNSLVPAADHLALADCEAERLAARARRIEHGTVLQRAGVVHNGGLAILRVGLSCRVERRGRRSFQMIKSHESFGAIYFQKPIIRYILNCLCIFSAVFI